MNHFFVRLCSRLFLFSILTLVLAGSSCPFGLFQPEPPERFETVEQMERQFQSEFDAGLGKWRIFAGELDFPLEAKAKEYYSDCGNASEAFCPTGFGLVAKVSSAGSSSLQPVVSDFKRCGINFMGHERLLLSRTTWTWSSCSGMSGVFLGSTAKRNAADGTLEFDASATSFVVNSTFTRGGREFGLLLHFDAHDRDAFMKSYGSRGTIPSRNAEKYFKLKSIELTTKEADKTQEVELVVGENSDSDPEALFYRFARNTQEWNEKKPIESDLLAAAKPLAAKAQETGTPGELKAKVLRRLRLVFGPECADCKGLAQQLILSSEKAERSLAALVLAEGGDHSSPVVDTLYSALEKGDVGILSANQLAQFIKDKKLDVGIHAAKLASHFQDLGCGAVPAMAKLPNPQGTLFAGMEGKLEACGEEREVLDYDGSVFTLLGQLKTDASTRALVRLFSSQRYLGNQALNALFGALMSGGRSFEGLEEELASGFRADAGGIGFMDQSREKTQIAINVLASVKNRASTYGLVSLIDVPGLAGDRLDELIRAVLAPGRDLQGVEGKLGQVLEKEKNATFFQNTNAYVAAVIILGRINTAESTDILVGAISSPLSGTCRVIEEKGLRGRALSASQKEQLKKAQNKGYSYLISCPSEIQALLRANP